MRRIKSLEQLATEMVGDSGIPNLYFVSRQGAILTVTRDLEVAYNHWLDISENGDQETALEDRKVGVLASIEPEGDAPDAPLRRIDDVYWLGGPRRKS